MDINDFVNNFLKEHNALLNNIIRRYLIPNRYNTDDVKQYIAEKMIYVLTNREIAADNKIENPEKYFLSCISFYCIEYQRMHGFIFELPKRPRRNCEEQEKDIRQKGFKYIGDLTVDESMTLLDTSFPLQEDIAVEVNNPAWHKLTGLVSKEEADVIDCIYNRNMTWTETSSYLNVPQSTCWFRKNRALQKLMGIIGEMPGNLLSNLKGIIRDGEED